MSALHERRKLTPQEMRSRMRIMMAIGDDTSRELWNSGDFSNLDLEKGQLSGAGLKDADMTGANLKGLRLIKVNLSNTNLTDVDLSETYLCEETLESQVKKKKRNALGNPKLAVPLT